MVFRLSCLCLLAHQAACMLAEVLYGCNNGLRVGMSVFLCFCSRPLALPKGFCCLCRLQLARGLLQQWLFVGHSY
jgi:hypothetical protein